MRPIRKKEDEPKVACPVCQAETKASELTDAPMCSYCATYLTNGGTDHGNFMVRVRTVDDTGRRMAEIRPRGFWSDAIEIRERLDHRYNVDTKEIDLSWEVEISWGSGGNDGTRSSIEASENFTRAMDHAVMLAKSWRMERQENKEA